MGAKISMRHHWTKNVFMIAGAVALGLTVAACSQIPMAIPIPTPQAAAPPSLAGTWMATGYTCPGGNLPVEEEIKITQFGNAVRAMKVVGDDCVPSGAMTWQGTVSGYSFPVQVQVSFGPRTPLRLAQATVTLTGADSLQLSAGWTLMYRRVGP
jgi:hypothetical protein